jgi:multicomponent K+:H+ antiporter subunit G
MSQAFLAIAIVVAQLLLLLAMACSIIRMVRGPRAQDRVLALLGAGFTFTGSLGLLRLRDFYKRVHAPTLGSTLGTFFMVAAAVPCFSVLQGRPALHVMLIGVFLTLTTPITLMLLVRAALYRNRVEGGEQVPPR